MDEPQPFSYFALMQRAAESGTPATLLLAISGHRLMRCRQFGWVATHIDACFARRFRLPIAIGDSVGGGIDRVDR